MKKIKLCVFTNGRSSLKHCLKSLNEQSLELDEEPWIISGKNLTDAFHSILHATEYFEYFMKIDDDFMFHPRAIEHMQHKVGSNSGWLLHSFRLWDVEHGKRIQSVKVYHRRLMLARKIKIKADSRGRIDGPFLKRISGVYKGHSKDHSIVALHSHCSIEDIQLHNDLWKNGKKANDKKRMSMDEQYDKREEMIDAYNKGHNTLFWQPR